MDSEETTSKDSESTSSHSSNVDLQDTFVTLQTKQGQSSKQIPLVQFLEQIVGTRIDSSIKASKISMLLAGQVSFPNNSAAVTDGQKADDSSVEEKEKSVTEERVGVPLDGGGATSVTPHSKPKGRGRPRKVRVDMKTEDMSELKICSASNTLKPEINPSTSAEPSSNTIQTLRRSSRIPAKNSRFKDDFVDSSSLPSKAVTSGDTRLMTLALAAECHTTKPNKRSLAVTKGTSSEDSVSSTPNIILSDVVQDKASSGVCSIVKKEQKKPDSNDITPSSLYDQVIQRSLHAQMDLIFSSIENKLVHSVPQAENIEKGKSSNFLYYIITEPRIEPSGDVLLVKKNQDGLEFNMANASHTLLHRSHDSAPVKQPLPRWFLCESCDKIFHNAHQWNLHCRDLHSISSSDTEKSQMPDKGIFTCKFCNQKFPFQFMLDHHLKNQSSQCNRFLCVSCESTFSTMEALRGHQLLAHPTNHCSDCGKSFPGDAAFHGHLRDCKGSESTRLQPLKPKRNDLGLMEAVVVKIENPSTCQQQAVMVLKQPQQEDMAGQEMVTAENMDKPSSQINCELCSQKFSTFSGLWYHKLETHGEFYPAGFKRKLESRLEKNQQQLSILPVPELLAEIEEDRARNNFYIVMRPKWCTSQPQVQVSLENKKFEFLPVDTKISGPSTDHAMSLINKVSVFHCKPCSIYFQSASGYREHRSKVHAQCFETVRYMGAFQCTHCSDTFPCQFMLKEHLKRHTKRKSLPCTLCGLMFHRIQERRHHWKQDHPGVGCPNCGKMYASIKYLQKHISLNCQDHYPASRKFIAFRKRQHNDFHMEEKDKRVEKKIIKCHLCPKICSSIHGWRRHMSENHEDQGFSKLSNTCIICSEVIYGYKALEKHLLEVHAEESGLPIEEENSMVKEALKKSKIDLKDYMKAGKPQTEFYQDEEGNYHCPECPKTHADPKALAIHLKTHINMQLECSVCHKTFKNPTLLRQHVMRHRTTAIYDCHTCHKKFMTLQKLNKHNKVHHSKESFVCELCGMSFALNDYLLKHKRCHTDKRPHLCSVCGKTFRTKPELRVHVLIHTQETPYVCEHCGRGFTQKGNWRIHLAQHTGLKPHKCPHCELSFALPSHLKRHLLTHNQKINYRCVWCDKECTQRKHMQMHVSRVHKEDFFHYEEQMKLDSPIPIAPSQLKIYNRRLGKAGQVRKAYKSRAKKCNSSIQDIIEGNPIFDASEHEMSLSGAVIKHLIGQGDGEESVSPSISIGGHEVVPDGDGGMHILVRGEDHGEYATKQQDVPASLIQEDGSNVEIVMGENNEINIIINKTDTPDTAGINLSLQDGLEDHDTHVSLQHDTHVTLTQEGLEEDNAPVLLQQAVSVLVDDTKQGANIEVTEAELPLGMEAIMTGDSGDSFTIVYPPPSS